MKFNYNFRVYLVFKSNFIRIGTNSVFFRTSIAWILIVTARKVQFLSNILKYNGNIHIFKFYIVSVDNFYFTCLHYRNVIRI